MVWVAILVNIVSNSYEEFRICLTNCWYTFTKYLAVQEFETKKKRFFCGKMTSLLSAKNQNKGSGSRHLDRTIVRSLLITILSNLLIRIFMLSNVFDPQTSSNKSVNKKSTMTFRIDIQTPPEIFMISGMFYGHWDTWFSGGVESNTFAKVVKPATPWN